MVEPNVASAFAMPPAPVDLSGQGFPEADFRIERRGTSRCRISLLSTRARRWFEENFLRDIPAPNAREIETNLDGANAFIRKARLDGFRTEYVGPLSKSYF